MNLLIPFQKQQYELVVQNKELKKNQSMFSFSKNTPIQENLLVIVKIQW
ncbi:unnamed protein product [Paramecium sonneborni]|uniref:Uncharacterized protein n=1 Tax=Paramecium sonneborni TaxID=65129 RepID=A0A8S1R3P2_9CILI|nr:unnamed protein product [Paramecium sonneborni]